MRVQINVMNIVMEMKVRTVAMLKKMKIVGFSDAAIGFVLVKIDIVVMLKKEDENGGKW